MACQTQRRAMRPLHYGACPRRPVRRLASRQRSDCGRRHRRARGGDGHRRVRCLSAVGAGAGRPGRGGDRRLARRDRRRRLVRTSRPVRCRSAADGDPDSLGVRAGVRHRLRAGRHPARPRRAAGDAGRPAGVPPAARAGDASRRHARHHAGRDVGTRATTSTSSPAPARWGWRWRSVPASRCRAGRSGSGTSGASGAWR